MFLEVFIKVIIQDIVWKQYFSAGMWKNIQFNLP